MKNISAKFKLPAFLLALCVALSLIPTAVFAAAVSYMPKIHVTYEYIKYKAGDEPRATAQVIEGNCVVAYEYWRELEQKEEGGYWTGTGRYWYSDPDKMESLAADKRITRFEAGHHYGYNIVLTANSGYFIGDDTVVSVGEHEWGKAGSHTNLEIKSMSTRLNVYGIYAVDLPDDNNVITGVSIINVNKDLISSAPVTFTAKSAAWCAERYDIIEEAWEACGSVNDIIKSTDAAPRAPIADAEYSYSIVLRAKDGYVFSKDFSDSNHRIKDGSEVTFALGGELYESKFHVSDDGKTLTAWEFMNPVKVKSSESSPDYKITEGAAGIWKPGSGTLVFKANGDFSKFTGVKVDGSLIYPDKYTAVSGSTVITLKSDFLSSLSAGSHTLTAVYTDGECSASFEIKSAGSASSSVKSPQTGNRGYALPISLLLISGAFICTLILYKSRKFSVK